MGQTLESLPLGGQFNKTDPLGGGINLSFTGTSTHPDRDRLGAAIQAAMPEATEARVVVLERG
jgi:hypothetical protein